MLRQCADYFTRDRVQALNLDDLPFSAFLLPGEFPAGRFVPDITIPLDVNSAVGSKVRTSPIPFTEDTHVQITDGEVLNLRDNIKASFDHRLEFDLSRRDVPQRVVEVEALDVIGKGVDRDSDLLAISDDEFVSEITADGAGSAQDTGDQERRPALLRPYPGAHDREHGQNDHRGPGTLGEPHDVSSRRGVCAA